MLPAPVFDNLKERCRRYGRITGRFWESIRMLRLRTMNRIMANMRDFRVLHPIREF